MIPPFDFVIYHGNCNDGFTAAWIAHKHSPNAVFLPFQHGDKVSFSRFQGKRVLIVDFSFPRKIFEDFVAHNVEWLLLDHHKTAESDLVGVKNCIFDQERCGASLTWDVLFPGQKPPYILQYVEDQDLGRYRYEDTRVFHAALMSVPMTFQSWDGVENTSLKVHIDYGHRVHTFLEGAAQRNIHRSKEGLLDGFPCWFVNANPEVLCEAARSLLSTHPKHIVLGWYWDAQRDNFYCSIRSNGNIDVSPIAQRFGGGGHPYASGFRVTDIMSLISG